VITDQTERSTDAYRSMGAQRITRGRQQIGPLQHMAAERERLRNLRFASFTVERLGATVGAVLHGVDLSTELSGEQVADLEAALAAYKVIFFREQPLTPEQHLAFASRFGALEVHPLLPADAARPEIVRFAKSADVAGYENDWHHDVTFREQPSRGAVLRAVEVPECGGDTLFSDVCAAYDGLDDELKAHIDTLDATHDFEPGYGRSVPADRIDAMRAALPVVVHPVAPRHPVTGRRYLYVNRFFTTGIVGMDPEQSADLIDRLLAESTRPEYQCRFQWRPGSIALWDNHAVQHYASSDYWPDRRVMERVSIVGHRPTRG
jgi:alpha-ketoglutarate-dependent sulfate ester dioxygenase